MRCFPASLLFAVAAWLLVLAPGCPGGEVAPNYPAAEIYEVPTSFEGEWLGEVAGVSGMLKISDLGGGRYYGLFRADDKSLQYALELSHVIAEQGDASEPTNLVKLEWQDGRGGGGLGWLLINRENTALTGAFGRGEHSEGFGEWTFIRLE